LESVTRQLSVGLHLAVYGLLLVLFRPEGGTMLWALGLGSGLAWISMADLETLEIPDLAVISLVLTGAIRLWLAPGLSIANHIAGGGLWPLLIWSVAALYARLRGWQGLGFGDVKLMAAIGLWVGFTGTILVLFAASLSGILAILALAMLQRRPLSKIGTSAVAFGPFLCLSAWVIWLQGQG
jgi:leader peptidase (prepilin peptidase)/N-methyltransferase